MAKRGPKMDPAPFVPSLSPACCLADLALVFSVVLIGLAAAAFSLLRAYGG